jgi:hypothetical protein
MALAAMRSSLPFVDRRLMRRAAAILGAYALSALVLLGAVVLLRRTVTPQALRAALAFFFISSTVGGLDPATARAAALQPDRALDRPAASFLLAGAIKAVAVAPLLAAVWRFSDPQIPWGAIAWLPLVCAAGFWITDLRVLFDLRGQHGAAIGLKQGVFSGAALIVGLTMAAGGGLEAAIGLSTLARLVAAVVAARMTLPSGGSPRQIWRETRVLLSDVRWVEFAAASLLGAAAGSADRVIGLRYLRPAAFSAYYLTYESLTRFCLIAYLLSPVIYARSVGGRPSRALILGSWGLTAVAGLGFLAVLAGAFALLPRLIRTVVGASLPVPTLALGLAVVLTAFAQLRMAQLQAAGWSRLMLGIIVVLTIVSPALFMAGALTGGAGGLMWAWLAKAALEFALLMALGSAVRRPGEGRAGRARAFAEDGL